MLKRIGVALIGVALLFPLTVTAQKAGGRPPIPRVPLLQLNHTAVPAENHIGI
jgi:hypothetical protein